MWSSVPALLTRMSIDPKSFLMDANTSRICSRLVTSILMAAERRPICRISSLVFSAYTTCCEVKSCASADCDASALCSISGSDFQEDVGDDDIGSGRASVRQSALPRPRDPPVTTATFPVSSNMQRSSRGW